MTDEVSFLHSVQQNWESITTAVGGSVAAMWTMLKAHARRLDRVEQKTDSLEEQKATREELNRSVASIRADFNVKMSDLKADLRVSKEEIRQDIKSYSDNISQQLDRAIRVAEQWPRK